MRIEALPACFMLDLRWPQFADEWLESIAE